LYTIFGNAYRRDPTGRAGNDVGDKVDFLVNFHLSQWGDLYAGYSYLWGANSSSRQPDRTRPSMAAWLTWLIDFAGKGRNYPEGKAFQAAQAV
jgi:hypothetical protein